MLIKRLILPICLTVTLAIQAQDSLLLRDYTFMKYSDPWLNSPNAAALTRFASQNIAQAELSLSGEKGGFTNYNGSDDATLLNANVESFYRYNQRTVFFGSMSYKNFSGRHMAGSAFINPERKPFDLVEDSLTNEGTKHRDTYNLIGGFGCQITPKLAIGAKMDYTAANMAKYKDLRHQNKLMDLQLTASVYAPVTSWLNLGAYYQHHRNTESIIFGKYGTSDKVYKTLISYANFTGHLEQFGQEGYTDKSREMPFVDNSNGGGIQFSFHDSQTFLYTDFTYAQGWGYYGPKSPYTITYSNHNSEKYRWQISFIDKSSKTAVYRVDMCFSHQKLQNDATTYRELKNASGATYYDYYTPVKNADRIWQDFSIGYTIHAGIRQAIPTWTIHASIAWMERQQTAYIFPFYRRQTLYSYSPSFSLCHNIIAKRGIWSFTLNGSYLKGEGKPYEDFVFQKPSDKQPVPPSMDAYLYREYQWLTASQFCIGGQAKYAFVWPNTRIKTFARLALSHRKANESYEYSNGQNRTEATLAIGCEF